MDAQKVNAQIQEIIDRWCERRELFPLAVLLPAWLYNNGLTDGWGDLAAALRSVSQSTQLPPNQKTELKRLFVEVDSAVRHRE